MSRTSQMAHPGSYAQTHPPDFFILRIFPNAVKIGSLLEPTLAPPQIAQLAVCLEPSFLIGSSLTTPTNFSPDLNRPTPLWPASRPTGSHPMHLIGESAGACLLIGLFSAVSVPVTPTEHHPLLQSAGTLSVPRLEGTAFQPQFQQTERTRCLRPPFCPDSTTAHPQIWIF